MTILRFEDAASIEGDGHDELIAEDPLISEFSFSFPFGFKLVQKFGPRVLYPAQDVQSPILKIEKIYFLKTLFRFLKKNTLHV